MLRLKKIILLCNIVLAALSVQGQHLLTYTQPNTTDSVIIQQMGNQLRICYASTPIPNPIPMLATHRTFIDYATDTIIYQTLFPNGEAYWYGAQVGENGYKYELLGDEKVGDHLCQKYKIVLFSNTIEIWTTTTLGFHATPIGAFADLPGVMVKYARNGQTLYQLQKVKKLKQRTPLFPNHFGTAMDYVELNQLEKEKLVIQYKIFEDDDVCFRSDFPTPEEITVDSVYHFSLGTVILKKVMMDTLPSHYSIFAELTEYSAGDAYDRTGSVFVIPVAQSRHFLQALQQGKEVLPSFTDRRGLTYQGFVRTEDYEPLVELMRFFTPFGVRHYNAYRSLTEQPWAESVTYKEDISELRPFLCGEVYVGVFIGNYDAGGHKVSLTLKAYPGDKEWRREDPSRQWVLPLFNTCNVMEMSGQNYGRLFKTDSLTLSFEVPEGIGRLTLRYITTGHGGWGEGDEFVPRTNHILIDGQPCFTYTPWCTDCATFRQLNPASGNFWNGLSSSDYSRSGWCPGRTAQPVYFDLSHLPAGKHTLTIAIPQGDDIEGGFNAWSVSGVLIGEKE